MNSWKPYVPSPELPWNFQRAKHLHRRASFGATWSELNRDVKDGVDAAVNRLLSGRSRESGLREDFDEIAKIIGDNAVGSNDANRLKAWWLFRICFTNDPLQEKLTLLWHNHFATSNLKVRNLLLMRNQNDLFRKNAQAKFGVLLHEVLRDPAMLIWLDANSNRKGTPNENLARELMELFTLGVGHYSEDDVKESARALTGWSAKQTDVRFRKEWHDAGQKTILGKTKRFDADSLADLLLTHEATSRRLAWRLCDLFMGENFVSVKALDELANGLRKHQLDIGWAVEKILRSELFFSDANIATRVSSPVEFMVNAVRCLELLEVPPSTLVLAEWCSRLGQDLFYPPNVGGWNGGRSWLTSRTIVGRSNFAAALVAGELFSHAIPPNLQAFAERHQSTSPTNTGRIELFESLLLSKPCSTSKLTEADWSPENVAHLLSCPQAHLI